jgi:C4-type Zn-finger protein
LTIPEIDLELTHGTLGGRFTTVEGILDQVYEELSDKVFASGDSSIEGDKMKFEKFLSELKAVSNHNNSYTTPYTQHLLTNKSYRSRMLKDHSRSFSMIHSQIHIFRVCMHLIPTLGWRWSGMIGVLSKTKH